MTQAPTGNVVEVKPAPTVYTVLIIISLVALMAGIGFAGYRLMADVPDGYGLSAGDLLKKWEDIRPAPTPAGVRRSGRTPETPR
jgi:hypothetical protein